MARRDAYVLYGNGMVQIGGIRIGEAATIAVAVAHVIAGSYFLNSGEVNPNVQRATDDLLKRLDGDV